MVIIFVAYIGRFFDSNVPASLWSHGCVSSILISMYQKITAGMRKDGYKIKINCSILIPRPHAGDCGVIAIFIPVQLFLVTSMAFLLQE